MLTFVSPCSNSALIFHGLPKIDTDFALIPAVSRSCRRPVLTTRLGKMRFATPYRKLVILFVVQAVLIDCGRNALSHWIVRLPACAAPATVWVAAFTSA